MMDMLSSRDYKLPIHSNMQAEIFGKFIRTVNAYYHSLSVVHNMTACYGSILFHVYEVLFMCLTITDTYQCISKRIYCTKNS